MQLTCAALRSALCDLRSAGFVRLSGFSVENKINRNDRSLKFTTTPVYRAPRYSDIPPSVLGIIFFYRNTEKAQPATELYLSLSISFYVVRYGSSENFLLASSFPSDDGCQQVQFDFMHLSRVVAICYICSLFVLALSEFHFCFFIFQNL